MLMPKSSLYGDDIPSSEITPESVFANGRPARMGTSRRGFLAGGALAGAGVALSGLLPQRAWADTPNGAPLKTVPGAPQFQTAEPETPYQKATTYNNFYEFGTEKDDPARNAHTMHTRPWPIKISGLVKTPRTINIDDLAHYRPLESRIYRHRCVEAWSMVIPWDGYSLSEFIKFCEPQPGAKYVQFISLANKRDMPDLPSGFNWPYSEGLRMDEAMHPLTMLTFGAYGQVLANQAGAPVRVNVPWKWGYKSAKSIVEFRFVAEQPHTTWNDLDPEEYGFYSNVNPNISHRWSQAQERRIDGGFPHSVSTRLFNGYGDQVASLYNGMDLTKFY